MPTELIIKLANHYMNVYDVLHLRTTCQKMRDILNVRVVKKMWIERRKKVEQDLFQNRMRIVRGFNEARPTADVGNTMITFKGDTRNFFKAIKANKRVIENAEEMNVRYEEADLGIIYMFSPLNFVKSEELPFKPTRVLPIYGSKRNLERILQELDVYRIGAIWTVEEGS